MSGYGDELPTATLPPMDGDRFVPYSEAPERHVYQSGGIKDNVGKSRIDLVPRSAIFAAGEILAFGALKYKPHNWRYGLPWGDTFASMQRHLWAWLGGEDLDPETGKPHLWHGLCQLMFLVEYEATGTGTDDRWLGPPPDPRTDAVETNAESAAGELAEVTRQRDALVAQVRAAPLCDDCRGRILEGVAVGPDRVDLLVEHFAEWHAEAHVDLAECLDHVESGHRHATTREGA